MGLHSLPLILVAGAALPLAAEAESADRPKAKAEASATVTVTAEATPVELVKTPNPVKVITEEAIQRSGAKTLGELLAQELPGQVTSYGGPGTLSEVYLGGSRSQDVVVLLDGLRIADALGLGTNFANISLVGIERVEILTGPASTRYGADTHGGVVALYSNAPAAKGLSGQLSEATGTQGTQRVGFAPAYGWTSGWVRAALGAEAADTSIRTDHPYRSASTFLGVGQQLGGDTLLTASYRNLFQGTPLPFTWPYPGTTRVFDAAREENHRFEMVSATLQSTLTPAWSLDAALGQVVSRRTYVQDGYRFDSRRNEAKVALHGAWGGSGVDLGLEGQEAFGWYGDAGAQAYVRNLALLAEGHWEVAPTLRLVLGAREQWDRTGDPHNAFSPAPEQAHAQFTWKAGLNWLPTASLRLYASLGTSYNAADLYKVSYNASHGAAPLGPEQSRSVLVGSAWSQGPWSLRLDLNRILYSDFVAYIPSGLGYYANQSDVRVQGAELALGYRTAGWGTALTLRSQEGRALSLPEDQQLRTFASRPFFSAGLQAFWVMGSTRLDFQLSHLGHRYNYVSDLNGVEANPTHFTDANLALTWAPTAAHRVTLRADHLLQGTYTRQDWEAGADRGRNDVAVLPGFLSPGRTFTLELRYRF